MHADGTMWLGMVSVPVVSVSSGCMKVVKGSEQRGWRKRRPTNAVYRLPLLQPYLACASRCCSRGEIHALIIKCSQPLLRSSFLPLAFGFPRPWRGWCCVSGCLCGFPCCREILDCGDLNLRQKSSSLLHFLKLVAQMLFVS